MSVSAVSTSATYQSISSTSNDRPSGGGAMKSLADGINSGDLTSARAAFDTLQKHRQGAGATASATTGSTAGTSQRDQDIAAIGKALDSGDADAAKQALAKLQEDRKNAAGSGGATQGTHQAHHHHGHKAQAGGGSSATSGTTPTASMTYSASASTAPTAAPGSTIDVTA
ncbi:hypothetical protein [Massilia luteola]|uniref:hypothetical protein n=1 Tax=Massilia luteola TaxID=3081751 RepID=UPI002ACC17AA|nr:hypothetical protein [Massilia sp. Gc5]